MESFDRPLCRNDTFSPFDRPPLQGNFCASQSAAVTKVKGWPPSVFIRFVSEPFQRERPKLLFCLLPPPSFVRGEVEGGFSKESLPSEKLSLERGKKGGGGRERRNTGRETARVHGLQGHGSGIGFGLGKDFGRMGVTCNQPLLILTS